MAISCKGHEMSEDELLDFAHKYLKEMGYGESGQPLLVYSHYDTENTHLHIITSRVAPDGGKIQHSHERRRSQEVIDRILGNDRKKKTENDIDAAKQYTFSSFAQFKAIMVSMGYEVYQKDKNVFVKHGGKVQKEIPFSEIESLFKSGYRERTRCRQLRSLLKKYRDVSSNKDELQKELKTKFGIDIVFFGKKDAPYGYMLVDHANKTVIHGARVLSVEELLDFTTPEERFNRIEDYIDRLLTLNPKITQSEIYSKIRKQRAYIKKGIIYFDGQSRPLKPFMAEAIDRNNRIAMVEMFSPANEAERDLLCKIFKVSRTDLVDISPERTHYHIDAVNRLREIFNDDTVTSVRSQLHEEGFIVRQDEDVTYAINFKQHIIINLTEENFNLDRPRKQFVKQIERQKYQQQTKPTSRFSGKGKLRDAGGGSHSEKREWEVGQKGSYDDVDDGNSIRR
ncbi:relaxase/mobilization nuclease domain protein [Phocaeicola vulgatus str. 3775 SL(B) 10 (iv)]|uniref:Relaxase/mobilization nuclease domain protein n=1 Tax=Phocaeicola vulgatus str. 3775 SL(B) 10 (iv) TaxID=1339350 RepID=A0A078R7Q9_PHOVU|nr:relaxase/mobilization nuclease domain protein [Phocaeicola vulgatus str. 3775 SR(B) 19]KDS31365.1 relaxase/mobilization nuclease domain protein [Phocaeicola vulgatus str. 3775 SL(B) 10 (iv)]